MRSRRRISEAAAAARQAGLLAASPALRPLISRADHRRRLEWALRLVPGSLLQIPEEIIALAEHSAPRRPQRIAEIGTYNGGTSLFLCGLSPSVRRFVGVDPAPHNDGLVAALAPRAVKVTFLRGSSRDSTVRGRMAAAFAYEPIDLLFIDGDHRYEGVRADLLEYRHMVSPGGLIAFHDIVPDHGNRSGADAQGWAGGVPDLWRELRERFVHWEFVRDWSQDGCGIGVIQNDPAVTL